MQGYFKYLLKFKKTIAIFWALVVAIGFIVSREHGVAKTEFGMLDVYHGFSAFLTLLSMTLYAYTYDSESSLVKWGVHSMMFISTMTFLYGMFNLSQAPINDFTMSFALITSFPAIAYFMGIVTLYTPIGWAAQASVDREIAESKYKKEKSKDCTTVAIVAAATGATLL